MSELFSWQQSYQAAMLELNLAELRVKLKDAIFALQERGRELMFARDAESAVEWQAIADALNNLSVIERYELSSPEISGRNDAAQQGAL